MKAMGFTSLLPQITYKIDQIESLLNFEPLIFGDEKAEDDMTIRYSHVSFSYEDTEVIHDVNLTLPEGSVTAFVGESGSGKSTLAKLLVHFYDPDEGEISIGGKRLSDLSLTALNENIAFVSQEQFLFNRSIADNIRIGKPDAGDEEILEAAKRAECMEFIDRLPDGMNTVAGDSGKMLSGGERQRVSIARAILKNAGVIVLDEATAYVDPENAGKIDKAIQEVTKGKTVVIIGHKLQNLTGADQIVVLDSGRVIGTGTHGELLESCGHYRKLWEAADKSKNWTIAGELGKEAL